MEEDVFQLLAGALPVLEAAGCALVGGHTSEGAELSLGSSRPYRAASSGRLMRQHLHLTGYCSMALCASWQAADLILAGAHAGFCINGSVEPSQALRKGGMRSGQALVLTKPLGTGILLAGHMRRLTKGRWLTGEYCCTPELFWRQPACRPFLLAAAYLLLEDRLALMSPVCVCSLATCKDGAWMIDMCFYACADAVQSMQQSSEAAGQCLVQHGVSACTDVTGFGLLGHLNELARASKVTAPSTQESSCLYTCVHGQGHLHVMRRQSACSQGSTCIPAC